ncbi:MAG: stage III sporulation protein AF [Clostridia bacterium]|nr:stage III sporulation protein AF [Clostridia bacterium]
MKEYLGALVATTLLGGIVRMLAPEGNLQKYLRLTVSLCLVAALLGPLLGALGKEREVSLGEIFSEDENLQINYDEIYHHSLENATKKQAEQIIKTKIFQKFSLSEETARITANFVTENDKIEISEIYVSLQGNGVLTEPREIVSFVRTEWGCPCVILYE